MPSDQDLAVMEAGAHELNNELTVIFMAITEAIEHTKPGDCIQGNLHAASSAAQRMAWQVSAMLNYAADHGAKAGFRPVETLIEESRAQ